PELRPSTQAVSLLVAAILVAVTAPFTKARFATELFAIAGSWILGAPDAPSAIAIGLSRSASPSTDRIGFPGSSLVSSISVHVAFHISIISTKHPGPRR